ncbi:RCC1 and BTB domain-containing protein 1 [Folsomia candida]|uniref:RCC1 and BTB domain-containing protein 1 n=1 Tax=Folsomia candida TaxID=158441 RepID=A0A226DBX3_FOLCA|nr:RCC1 and BTB domain-containing protein 1 [Folsomia candida]OXA42408.1 RCC1 and BTB domain-containing protein 1 [Folsomia candida]
MEPSSGVIPTSQLTIWDVFDQVEPEGEEILKTVKLAHVNNQEGFVVTTADETYAFTLEEPDDGSSEVVKTTRIPELCGVQVKEFAIGSINLAITEDGQVYSWCSNSDPDREQVQQLGRVSGEGIRSAGRPAPVTGSLTGQKVVQVAIPGEKGGHVVALTVSGEVYEWGPPSWVPRPMPRGSFGGKKIISVACRVDHNLALTEDGRLFEWGLGTFAPPHRSELCGPPVIKIVATNRTFWALTVNGNVHWWRARGSKMRDWTRISDLANVEDIVGCWIQDVLVVEARNKSFFGCHLAPIGWTIEPYFKNSIDKVLADLAQISYRTLGASMKAKQRTLGGDIANLWRTKENSDITFTVEGKTITAHKFILTCRSEYFAKMLSNEWKEGNGSEIVINDTVYAVFEAILFYIYHEEVKFAKDEYENIFDLMKLADSYCEITIRQECEKILIRNVSKENAFFLVRNAALANASDLERTVVKFILEKGLLSARSPPQELIDLVGMEAFQK